MKVLCVEDDPDLREILTLALALEPSLDVRVHATGAAALAALNSHLWRPDAFLLDVMMPRLDGRAILREIRRREAHARTPVVFISTDGVHGLAEVDPNVVGLLPKPFDAMTLGARLLQMLRRSPEVPRDGDRP